MNLISRIHRLRLLERLAYLDVPQALQSSFPIAVGSVLFGLACSLFAIASRWLIDMGLPGAGPFAVMVPTVLVATLFGRWLAGIVCLAISSLYAWYFVLPAIGSFNFDDPTDGPRVFVNIASGVFVVALAELFQKTMRKALSDRELLLLELEHRVRNNFASIASLLNLQLRRAEHEHEDVVSALQTAIGRVESYARANSFLYRNSANMGGVEMRTYLQKLCDSLNATLGDRSHRIFCDVEAVDLPRDRAIVVGLLVNEVVTNSIKHAFDEGASGRIDVKFNSASDGFKLLVRDNGCGMSGDPRNGALGLNLIDALSKQAAATFKTRSDKAGTTFDFDLEF